MIRASRVSSFALASLLVSVMACSPGPPAALTQSAGEDGRTEERAIARMLDDWHDAAANADEARYFGHIAENGVFLGTDARERWTKPEFLAYAHPHFAAGKAWKFRAVERHVQLGASRDVAWFDERLETEKLGPSRGSGTVVRGPSGAWEVAHYDLSVPIPNERFAEVRALIAK
jgi:hypothetical protein